MVKNKTRQEDQHFFTIFGHFIDETIDQLIQKIIDRFMDGENNRKLQPSSAPIKYCGWLPSPQYYLSFSLPSALMLIILQDTHTHTQVSNVTKEDIGAAVCREGDVLYPISSCSQAVLMSCSPLASTTVALHLSLSVLHTHTHTLYISEGTCSLNCLLRAT